MSYMYVRSFQRLYFIFIFYFIMETFCFGCNRDSINKFYTPYMHLKSYICICIYMYIYKLYVREELPAIVLFSALRTGTGWTEAFLHVIKIENIFPVWRPTGKTTLVQLSERR